MAYFAVIRVISGFAPFSISVGNILLRTIPSGMWQRAVLSQLLGLASASLWAAAWPPILPTLHRADRGFSVTRDLHQHALPAPMRDSRRPRQAMPGSGGCHAAP
jgi:hypothetical protein